MEGFGVGAESRRILKRCRDKLVEIDGLDVEGPAHVAATVLQDPHDFILIGGRIEVGLY